MKVLIADDEVIIREGMSNVIPWDDYGFRLLPPASSAEEVIQQLEEGVIPDILITDIRMKGMTGLELVSYITKQHYPVESILLTGYDDFEYTQEAIRQSVCDYLLKTSSPDEIIAAVNRAKSRLERVREYDQLKESEGERMVIELLKEAISNRSTTWDYRSFVEAMPFLENPPYQLLMVDVDEDPHQLQASEKLWNSYIEGKWFIYYNQILILVRRKEYLKDDYLLQIASRKIHEIYHKPMMMSTVVSSLNQLPALYQQLLSFLPYQRILLNDRMITEKNITNRHGIPYTERMVIHKEELLHCLKEGDEEKLRQWIEDFVGWLMNHPEATPESIQFYVQHLYIESIRSMNQFVEEKQPEKYESIPPFQQWFQQPKQELFVRLSMIMSNFRSDYHKRTDYVEYAMSYMENHLGEPLSLREVAETIPVHPNYLSEVIRKKTGKAYMELLTELRIHKAAEYLQYTSISVKEITELVGYKDSKYFTKIFKRFYQMTPTRYRSKIQ
ncbi:response regulator [Gracilibacillus phocaeensis]|uniref:response regulator n=1 Tax=Gracilibacillus phocaeensis TaxID=2042304 RepID=UPI00103181FD|nr:response regulator [Gracilibacillus phocaeensis]